MQEEIPPDPLTEEPSGTREPDPPARRSRCPPGNAWNWIEEHQQLFSNFTRYKTTTERSLLRWYKELEAQRGRELQFEQARESLRAKTTARPHEPLPIQRFIEFADGVPPEYSWAILT